MNSYNDQQDFIDNRAAEWVARMAVEPLSEFEQRALEKWLAADAANAVAFDEAKRAWALMQQLPHACNDATAVLAQPSLIPQPPVRRAWKRSVGALAASLLLAIGAVNLVHSWERVAADYYSATGITQHITLPDGSRIELGPDSSANLVYSATERRIQLRTGLAYFIVAPMSAAEQRPFIVEAGDGSVRALGTEFMVQNLPDSVEVAVTEHSVEVALAAPSPARPTLYLSEGEATHYGQQLGDARRTNVDLLTGWRRGRLAFNDMPLGDVVSVLNRYRKERIVIIDAALAKRAVSGVFEARNPDLILQAIAVELDIKATRVPFMLTLLH